MGLQLYELSSDRIDYFKIDYALSWIIFIEKGTFLAWEGDAHAYIKEKA